MFDGWRCCCCCKFVAAGCAGSWLDGWYALTRWRGECLGPLAEDLRRGWLLNLTPWWCWLKGWRFDVGRSRSLFRGKSPTPMSTESVPLAAWLFFCLNARWAHKGWPYKTLPRWPRWGSRKAYVDAWWHPPMIVDESGDILRRLVFNLSCQWLWQH